jgi:phage-related holin
MGRVCQMIGTLLKAWILRQVICKHSFTGIDKNLSCSLIEMNKHNSH